MDEALYNGTLNSQPTLAGSLGTSGLEHAFDNSHNTTTLHEPLPTRIQGDFVWDLENAAPQDTTTTIGMQDLLSRSPELHLLEEPIWPPPTPDLAPQWGPGSNLFGYHTDRAAWHRNAERFHRGQLQQLNEITGSRNPFSPLDQSLHIPDPCTSVAPYEETRAPANRRGGKGKAKKNWIQAGTSRISANGSVRKIDAASSKELPPHIAKAILAEAGYQQYAGVSASELHPRILNKLNFDPKSVYNQLTVHPSAWGPYCQNRQNLRFVYNEFGELEPGDMLTVEEMRHFLFNHPLHYKDGAYKPKEGGLILWIQRNPADSKMRFGHPSSARCRFKKCIAAYNLIGQGQNRVAFDELSCRGENLDPMHNAGYVHLYCLERFMDFPMICSTLRVKAEDRELPLEPKRRNRMLLSSYSERREAEKFIRNCEKGKVSTSYPPSEIPGQPYTFTGTLCNKLCIKKVNAEPEKVKRARVQRGNRLSTLTHHLGDLAMETEHRTQSRLAKNQVRLKASTPYFDDADLQFDEDGDQDQNMDLTDESCTEVGSPDLPMSIANMGSSSTFINPRFLGNESLNAQTAPSWDAHGQPNHQAQANYQIQPNQQAQSIFHTITPTTYPHAISEITPQEWQHSTQRNKVNDGLDYLFEDSMEK